MRFFWLSFLLLSLTLATRAEDPKPKLGDLITTQKGTLPIILSAPHGGRRSIPDCPERKGVGIDKFVSISATNTAELTEKIAARIENTFGAKPYVVIARFGRKYLDVNRPPEGAYESDLAKPYFDEYHEFLKESCKEIREDWGRGILLDIQGQGVIANALYRGTRDLETVKLLKERYGKAAVTGEKSLLGQLAKRDFVLIPANDSDKKETRYNGGYIVTTYGSHTEKGIDAIQLEFGGDFRTKSRLDKTADDLTAALEVFAKEYLPKEKKR